MSRKLPGVNSQPRTGEPKAPPTARSGASVDMLAPDPLINLLIDGRYRVISRMARGGMASVYVARDERLDRLVALKVMHPHLAESEQFTARFRQEARAAARISSPAVVPVYDQGAFHGQGYLVMELISGANLRVFISSDEPLDLGLALDFTEQILNGLDAAHRVGVVHRDLKPENVLVDQDKQVKIADFGLARAASEITLSSTGSIMGTVAYLAPEVALRGSTDGRTDIYAAGIILYEMLTGTVPGGNLANPVQVAMARVNEDIPSPSNITPWLPATVDDLITSFCARDARKRPASASEAAKRVAQVRANLSDQVLAQELPTPQAPIIQSPSGQSTRPLGHHAKTTLLPVEPRVVQTSGSVAPPEAKRHGPSAHRTTIIVTVFMLIVALALGVWWWWQQYGPGSYFEIPELAGLSVEEAQTTLDSIGISSTIKYENSDDVPEGEIIRTRPAATELIHRREDLTLFASLGVLYLTVPDLADLTQDEAVTLLQAEGLQVGEVVAQWDSTVNAGYVISSDPPFGEKTPHYTDVNITVSKGPEPIDVPNVLGMDGDEAVELVEGAGLQAEVTQVYSTEYPEGSVAAVDPAEGTTLTRGSSVMISISMGPEMIRVPGVYGKSREEAIQVLEDAGFTVEVDQLAGFFDSVGAQSPRAGSEAPRGSTVRITVV